MPMLTINAEMAIHEDGAAVHIFVNGERFSYQGRRAFYRPECSDGCSREHRVDLVEAATRWNRRATD